MSPPLAGRSVPLSPEEVERYSPHLVLDGVGAAGQQRLRTARVLIVGVGGLGSPAALYLAAAGVGTLGLVDDDVVDISNLQRQVLHHTPDVGTPKIESAAAKLAALNPHVAIETHRAQVNRSNAVELLRQYDFIIDGTDNFPAKFLLNDAAFHADRPLSHAGVQGFVGQLMTVVPKKSACYRCLFEAPPPQGSTRRCDRAGILGVLPAVIGSLQATEALKVLLGLGEPLTNTLLVYDALSTTFRKVAVPRNPRCALCGESPSIPAPGTAPSPAAAASPKDDCR